MATDDDKERKAGWTIPVAFAAGAIVALIAIGAMFIRWWPYQTSEIPPEILSLSELVRNFGLLFAGIAGIAIAIWRGKQTDDQIRDTRAQIENSRDQFELTRIEAQRSQDRETLREGARLLADGDPAIAYAGVKILEGLERRSSFSDEAKELLDTAFRALIVCNGDNIKDQALLTRACRTPGGIAISNKYFVTCKFAIKKSEDGELPVLFANCEFQGGSIYREYQDIKSDVSFHDCRFSDVGFYMNANIEIFHSIINTMSTNIIGKIKTFNCLFYNISELMYNTDDDLYKSARIGKIVDRNSTVRVNQQLAEALRAGGQKVKFEKGPAPNQTNEEFERNFFAHRGPIGVPKELLAKVGIVD